MEIKKLSHQEIKEIYYNQMQKDFPPEEIRPWDMFLRSFSSGLYIGYGLFENGKLLSYATFTFSDKLKNTILLDYYAVDQSLRGKGIGRDFLSRLIKQLDGTELILLEVENPSFSKSPEQLSVRTRRISFYKKCGANLSQITSKIFEADFAIMYISKDGKEKTDSEVQSALKEIYSSMFEKSILEKHIFIYPSSHSSYNDSISIK